MALEFIPIPVDVKTASTERVGADLFQTKTTKRLPTEKDSIQNAVRNLAGMVDTVKKYVLLFTLSLSLSFGERR